MKPSVQQIIDFVFGLSDNRLISEKAQKAVDKVKLDFKAPSGVVLPTNYTQEDRKAFAHKVLELLSTED